MYLLFFVDYKNMHVTPLFVSRHFRAPVAVSIFNSSRRENKNIFWKCIAHNSKIFRKNVSAISEVVKIEE